ncbi:MAG: rod shape-determining protein RodA [Gemmatimonadota bacterium]|nr:rod shape-determining protein RodA [Gemmatimonadota bacterium]
MLRRIFKPLVGDPPLFLAVSIMTVFGIGMIYSAGVLNIPSVVTEGAWLRQARWWALALGVFVAVRQVRAGWFEWIAVPAYIFSILLLVITLFVGKGSGTATGVRSFLDLGFLQFQPAELAKLATVLALARYLANRPEDPVTLRALVAPTAIVGLPLALVVLQPDLGTVLAFVGILFATLFWAGVPTGFLILLMSPAASLMLSYNAMIWAAFFLVLIVSLYLFRYRLFLVESLSVLLANLAVGTVANPLWNSLAEYQKNRILVFLDPSVDPRGAGYHLVQSMVAIGSGGLSGKGFTQGTQKAFDFLPEQHTDFIFSVIGEELGFIGTVFTLALFSFILYRLIRIAEEANPFAGLVIFGILGAWLMHIFVNVGMTVGMVPVTGIPLPFVSYGGTFLLMSWVAVGVATRLVQED